MGKNMLLESYLKSFIVHLGLILFLAASYLINKFQLFNSSENIELRNTLRVDIVGIPLDTIQELTNRRRKSDPDLPEITTKIKEEKKQDTKPSEAEKAEAQREKDKAAEVAKEAKEKAEQKEKELEKEKEAEATPSAVDEAQLKTDEQAKENQEYMNFLNKYQTKKVANESGKSKSKSDKNKKQDLELLKNMQNIIYRGNILSKGAKLEGDIVGEDLKLVEEYLEQVVELIRPNWNLPPYLEAQKLNCRIRIFINSSGSVSQMVIYKTSGVSEYDERALKAISDSVPFPVIPQQIRGALASGKVILGFPL